MQSGASSMETLPLVLPSVRYDTRNDFIDPEVSQTYTNLEPLLKTVYPLDSFLTVDRNLAANEAYGICGFH